MPPVAPRPRPLTASELPEPCRSCTYWELEDGRRGPHVPASEAEGAARAKDAWWRAAGRRWHPVALGVGQDPVRAWALLGPPGAFPRAGALGVTAADAAVLAQLWLADDDDVEAAGALVRAAAARAAAWQLRGLEAVASHGRADPCHPRLTLLASLGFRPVRLGVRRTVVRLDLRQLPGLRERVLAALRETARRVARPGEAPTLPTSPTGRPASPWPRRGGTAGARG
ncbi:MAG: hypothetical protein R6T85_07475 [Egibacteraceae bacterium]